MIEVDKKALVNDFNINKIININSPIKLFSESNRFLLVHNNSINLKIRTTNKEALLCIEEGNWHNDKRREDPELHFDWAEIQILLEILKYFGIHTYTQVYLNRRKYIDNDLIFTIEKYKDSRLLLFTVTTLINEESKRVEADQKLQKYFKKVGLDPLNPLACTRFLDSLTKIEKNFIDFNKINIQKWKEDNANLIKCEEIITNQ